jgi:folate-binding protein YgfZ
MRDDTSADPAVADAFALAAARDAAVVCDLSPLSVVAVSGAEAEAFLQGQLSCDVKALGLEACTYGSFNSPKGRMLANFVLWREPAEGGFALLLPRDIAESVAKRLRMYVLRSKVTVTDVSAATRRFGVGGPAAGSALRTLLDPPPAPFEIRGADAVTVLGLPGPRFVIVVLLPHADAVQAKLASVAAPASFAVWQWLTIRAGVPVVTTATQDAFVAQAANWDILGGIDFRKGCYTGQEIIARTHYLGRLKERTLAFHADAPEPAPGDRIYSQAFDDQPCGTVVNAAPAPGGGYDLLAVVQLAAAERGDARLSSVDGPPLTPLALPYAIPAKAPREREA